MIRRVGGAFVPRSDYYSDFCENHTIVPGGADGAAHPWEWDDDTIEQLVEEHNEQLARKRPCGFAAWPENPERR